MILAHFGIREYEEAGSHLRRRLKLELVVLPFP